MLLDHQTKPDLPRFFEVVLPVALASATPVEKRCRVEIAHERQWVIDFARGRVDAGTGGETVDARIRATAPDFIALLAGQLDGPRAIAEGRLVIEGDLEVVSHLAALLEAAGTAR